jgi:hypothetical protein
MVSSRVLVDGLGTTHSLILSVGDDVTAQGSARWIAWVAEAKCQNGVAAAQSGYAVDVRWTEGSC